MAEAREGHLGYGEKGFQRRLPPNIETPHGLFDGSPGAASGLDRDHGQFSGLRGREGLKRRGHQHHGLKTEHFRDQIVVGFR